MWFGVLMCVVFVLWFFGFVYVCVFCYTFLIPSVGYLLFVLEFFVSMPVICLLFLVFLVGLFSLPLSFPTSSVGAWLISSMLLCHQEIRHLVSVWRAPQFCFVMVHFICAKSVQGKICYFWCKFVNRLGGAGLIPSLLQKVFVSFFSAV